MADGAALSPPKAKKPKHHDTLALAFFNAQTEFGEIIADGLNAEKGYRWRTFKAIREALAPILHRNGLAFSQAPDGVESHDGRPTFMLKTAIIHAQSGAEMSGRYPVCDVRIDAHSKAACMTLARRYSLVAMMGVSAESEEEEPAHAGANADPEGIDQRPADEIEEESRGAFIMGEARKLVEGHYTALFAKAESEEEATKHWDSFQRKYWRGKRRCIAQNSFDGIEHLYQQAKDRLETGDIAFAKLTAAIAEAKSLDELEQWRASRDTEARFQKLSTTQAFDATRLYEDAQEAFAQAEHEQRKSEPAAHINLTPRGPAEEGASVADGNGTTGAPSDLQTETTP